MKSILITGAGGFVGSHAVEYFLDKGYKVFGIDSWRHKGCSTRLAHLKGRADLEILTHDLTSPLPTRLDWKPEYILNIASESHVERSIQDPVPFVENNVKLVLNVLEFARKVNPRAFIQCSTDEVFGPAPQGYMHKEWEYILPSNPYAASKASQDAITTAYWRTYGLPIIRTHCMNMIGERQDKEKFIPMVISNIQNGRITHIHGRPDRVGSRMYLHAKNLCDAWNFILEKHRPGIYDSHYDGEQRPSVFNIVGEKEVSNLDVVKLIGKIMGKEPAYTYTDFHATRPGHDRRYALDGTRLMKLGWKHPETFEESIEKIVKWTLDHKEWM